MSEYLDVAIEAIKSAEKIILEYYKGQYDVELKSDESPVTIADKKAETIIREIIVNHFPGHSFIGEEGGSTANSGDEYVWVIDPIDGTKNFIRGIPLFGTLIALKHNGEFMLGISNMPAMGELLYAERGQGAFLNGKRVYVSGVSEIAESYLSYGTLKYFADLEIQDRLIDFSNKLRWKRSIGDCWCFHLLAQGRIDIVAEAKVKIWDIAAFKVIVEEAGGKMTQLDGKPINLDTSSVIATNGHLHSVALTAFR